MNKLQVLIGTARAWLKAHPRAGYSIIAGGIVLFGGLSFLIVEALSARPSIAPDISIAPRPKVYYAPLTGEKVKNEATMKKPVTAVIIENSPDARPQSGLKDGEVVYEAIAEGGITRFMVLYQQHQPKLIGPVRSLRQYHLDLVRPYQASIAHVGGSWQALHKVRSGGWRDIDQFYNAGTYWRASDRYAPHNVYTNAKRLAALNKQKKYTTSNAAGFTRADDASGRAKARTVRINISSGEYNSVYRYDSKRKVYARSQAGAPHKDRERGQITAKVVVALRVKEKTVKQDTYREVITTIGSGKATIFQNGKATNVTWKRGKANQQLKFYLSDGKEFALARGTTWVALVPNGKGSVSWR